jgi:hypothetical protein
MPVHQWKTTPAGRYHHFHQQWMGELCDYSNDGALPKGFFSLVDDRTNEYIPDLLAIAAGPLPRTTRPSSAPTLLDARKIQPRVKYHAQESDASVYASRANRLAIRNEMGEIVAMIELVSPGNKNSTRALNAFIDKSLNFLFSGVNLLIIDLFPPTRRDPQGIHQVIWDHVSPCDFELPKKKPLAVVSYAAGTIKEAFVEPLAVGDRLPDMPLFIGEQIYIPAPLEVSDQATWNKLPEYVRDQVVNLNRTPKKNPRS